MTPGLVINGTVCSSGKVPSVADLKKWIADQSSESKKEQG
jgi:hypothetical protein